MGRGRQKAKQTKVARRLKYYTPDTDYQALERELTKGSSGPPEPSDPHDTADPYAAYYPDEDLLDQWSDLAQEAPKGRG
jgi:hypothetical protein